MMDWTSILFWIFVGFPGSLMVFAIMFCLWSNKQQRRTKDVNEKREPISERIHISYRGRSHGGYE